MSLAVYDAQGVLVREILRAVPQSAGEHVVDWDGTPSTESPSRTGPYGWKLLETAAFTPSIC